MVEWRDVLFHSLSLLHLFLHLHLGSAKKIWSNEVLSCNEVIEAQRDADGEWIGLSGNITSPDYPHPYPARLQCRVDFKAPLGYRIRLVFTHFHLFHPLNRSNDNCNAMDSLTIQDWSANHEEVQGGRIGRFCGPGLPLPVMSSGSRLTLMFRSYSSGVHVSGYKAVYTFVKDFGLASGHQLESHPCFFHFNSTIHLSGEICSPNPGGLYPRNTVCHYEFRGLPNQKVEIRFKYFDVEGVAPCTSSSDSDYIEFSNIGNKDEIIPRRCGRFAPKIVESEGPDFLLSFRSNDKYDGKGFAAEYKFVWRKKEVEEEDVLRPRYFPASNASERKMKLKPRTCFILVFWQLVSLRPFPP